MPTIRTPGLNGEPAIPAERYTITKSRSGHYTVTLFDKNGCRLFIQDKLDLVTAQMIGRCARTARPGAAE